MSDGRVSLSQDDWLALRQGLTARADEIRSKRLHLRVASVLPPAPLCPACAGPADPVEWSVVLIEEGEELLTDISPCGCRFRTELPLPWIRVTREDGGWFEFPDEP